MTTHETPGEGVEDSRPETSQPAGATPGATATQQKPPPPPTTRAIGLALSALIVGIVAFLVGLVPVLGALVGIVAVALGIVALRKRQSKGMSVTGIILGALAVIASIGFTIGIGAAVNNAAEKAPVPAAAQSESAQPEDAQPELAPEATEEAEAPVAPVAPAAPAVPVEFKSALAKAESYSESMYMSKAGIYDQLTSEYGEQFTPEAAQYAIDNVQADWNANALSKAKSYQEGMAMSPEAIRDQLTSQYGEKFTAEEAEFAVQNLNR